MTPAVGIEHLSAYVPVYHLALEDLARARGIDPEKFRSGLGVEAMAIAPPWEDAVTLAANAAAPLLERGKVERDEIGLLLVATESAVDHAKPVSIFVHELLGIGEACRTWELKHACYGGTAALMTAAQWIASGAARGRKALVIATDIARYDLRSAGEPTQGAGAVAMVVSESPSLLALDFRTSGSFARGVFDFWRPLHRREALVDGKYSLDCYLQALEGALLDHRRSAATAGAVPVPSAYLYHTPFPKMAWKAHRRLLEVAWRESGCEPPADEREPLARESFEASAAPWLAACRVVGNTYTASLYFCLASLLESRRLCGETIALFSYGSGCCAEFFTASVGRQATGSGLGELLSARRAITVDEYESMRAAAAEPEVDFRPPEGFRGRFWYAGPQDERRRYHGIGA